MDRHILISSDCHAGLPPGGYREYLDPEHRETFDIAMKQQIAMTQELEKLAGIAARIGPEKNAFAGG